MIESPSKVMVGTRFVMTAKGITTAALACWLVAASNAGAQQIGGFVREAGSATPVAGAVVSLVDASGRSVSRTITDERGRYGLTWPVAGTTLRVVRIGFRPARDHVLLGAPRDTALDITLDRLPATMLAPVVVSSDAVCSDSPDRRGALALWEQARAGLLAAIVAREVRPAAMMNLTFERRMELRTRRVTLVRPRIMTGSSNRPFVAARPAAALARNGYMAVLDEEQIYYAPDADVLLDESFATSHCFSVKRGDAEHRGQIGLAFEPRSELRRESEVDVRGVLWIEPGIPALTQLDFSYTGVPSESQRAGAGGTLRFQTMRNGVAFIAEWSMILPVLRPNATRRALVVSELSESGGFVLDARWPGGAEWRADISPVRGRVTDRTTHAPMAGVVVSIEGMLDSVTTDSAGLFTLRVLPPGLYALDAADTTFRHFVAPRTVSRVVTIAKGTGSEMSIQLPSAAASVAEGCKGYRPRPATTTLLGHISGGAGDLPQLVVLSNWHEDYSLERDAIGIMEANQSLAVDDAGRFFVCGVARQRPVRLRLLLGNNLVADTVVKVMHTTEVQPLEWSLRRGLLAAAQRGDVASLVGVVVNEDNGAPIAGADVWLPLSDIRANTDSAGEFRVHALSPGQHLLQVRRIGYAMRRDTATLFAGQETSRQYRLLSQVAMLETVHTIAEGARHLSPMMREFEERRAVGLGRFIAEEEMRKHDNRLLTDMLARMPGVFPISYGSATFIATSRGGVKAKAIPGDRTSPSGCWVAVYMDGILTYSGPPDVAPDMGRMWVRDFVAVEFYAGGASVPVQFNPMRSLNCGALVLWTRER